MSQIKKEEQIGGLVLHLKGQFLGGIETDELRDAIKDIANDGTDKLIINLADVSYLNSTALGVLIAGHSTFAKKEGKIVLCNISKTLENIFVITKLTLVFDIAENLEEAIKKIS